MKSLNGALMDCLVLPIQSKLEEWRKSANALDKEHAKEFKKHRAHIKKKSDQVVRLRKKMKKDSRSVPDPSVQRLVDQCLKDLNCQFRNLEDKEKSAVRSALVEERNRFCTFAACMKPVVDEELGMLGELSQVEEVMSKLGKVASNQGSLPDSCEQVIEDVRADKVSLCLSTPPSTPSSAMGSRKNSMCSISSIVSGTSSRASSIMAPNTSGPCSPTHSDRIKGSIPISNKVNHDTMSLSGSVRLAKDHPHNPNNNNLNLNANNNNHHRQVSNNNGRPGSAASAHVAIRSDGSTSVLVSGGSSKLTRPHTISSSFERNGVQARPPLSNGTFIPLASNSQPVSPSKQQNVPKMADSSLFEQSYSTIKRAYSNRGSPFRRSTQEPSQNGGVAKRPPLPHRCNSADGSSRPPGGVIARGSSVERPPSQASIQSENNNVRVIGFSSPKTHFSSLSSSSSSSSTSHQDTSNNGESPSHYAIPRSALKLQMVPDFLQGKTDMVIPQPVYMNTDEMKGAPSNSICESLLEDDLKTPTVEELSFPGQKVVVEDGTSSSSSGSIGSSSGYGSQNTIIKFDESQNLSSITLPGNHINRNGAEVISPTSTALPTSPQNQERPNRPLPSLAFLTKVGSSHLGSWAQTHPGSPNPTQSKTREDILSTLLGLGRKGSGIYATTPTASPTPNNLMSNRSVGGQYLRRSDSFTPGLNPNNAPRCSTLQRSSSQISKPVPPIRRTPSITSPTHGPSNDKLNNNHMGAPRSSSFQLVEDDDATPHGSVENISHQDLGGLEEMAVRASNVAENLRRIPAGQPHSPSTLRRSTSMSANVPPPCSTFDRDQSARRSLTLATQGSNQPKGVTFAPNPPTLHSDNNHRGYNENLYKKISTHHVIPVSSDKPSPEGEIYGFGARFKENTRHYFGVNPRSKGPISMSISYPGGDEAPKTDEVQNQMFLNSLSAKLVGSVQGQRIALGNNSRIPLVQPTPQISCSTGEASKSKLHREIQTGAFNLRKTPNINDRSAPKL
ncbi:GATA zinc finger domain-containing protein 7-like [Tigriopus californicus]|uniref:GATA zinc finger domain-containing protein 7-like n=1 Tax=Tigriopus californicus TaxID=6832 RepID=UPI0027DA3AE2|nr:GATA zinc finger domain-containing protein 7-like [Tigriopus californicus]